VGNTILLLPHLLTDFLNWMPSNDTQDDGDAEEIPEAADAAATASFQVIYLGS
jgi:hypothetical protein